MPGEGRSSCRAPSPSSQHQPHNPARQCASQITGHQHHQGGVQVAATPPLQTWAQTQELDSPWFPPCQREPGPCQQRQHPTSDLGGSVASHARHQQGIHRMGRMNLDCHSGSEGMGEDGAQEVEEQPSPHLCESITATPLLVQVVIQQPLADVLCHLNQPNVSAGRRGGAQAWCGPPATARAQGEPPKALEAATAAGDSRPVPLTTVCT